MSAQAPSPNPPPVPTSWQIYSDGVLDYLTGINITSDNSKPTYGFTGLMTVQQWTSPYYGTVEPGATFLFPANEAPNPPPYPGELYLNGKVTPPMNYTKGTPPTRHQMLCDLLSGNSQDPTFSQNFVGFSCYYPWYTTGNVGYNSSTCNPYWFGGERVLPGDWQASVIEALSYFLPNYDACPVPPKLLSNNNQMALTLQTDGSLTLELLEAGNQAQLWSFIQVPQQWNNAWYYIVNPYQPSTGNFQLFGSAEGVGLSAKPFAADDVTGQWMKTGGWPAPYAYVLNCSGSFLVMDSRGGITDPGTIVQLNTQNGGAGQMWDTYPPNYGQSQ